MIWWALQQLKSSDPDVRIKAARNLGSTHSRKAVPALIKALQDEDSQVRLAVIEALGKIGHPASAEPLAAALSRPANKKFNISAEKEAISKALVSVGTPAVSPLVAALASEDSETRRCAAATLGRIRDPQTVPALAGRLEDPRSEVRKVAALALGETGDIGAAEALTKALANRDFETRRAAAEALGLLGSDRATTVLIKAAEDANESVQIAAVNALGRIGGMPAAACLRSAASGGRKAVAAAASAALKSMTFSPATPEERAEVAVIRGEFDVAAHEGTAAVPALIRGLSYKDPKLRAEAARVLGSMGFSESVRPLLDALKDHNTSVQVASARALANIGEAARPGLEQLLSFYDASSVKLAAVAIGEIGSPDSVPALLDLVISNSQIPGEYPDLFDAVCAAADSIAKILSSPSQKISRQHIARGADLPERISLAGPSRKAYDLTALRAMCSGMTGQL